MSQRGMVIDSLEFARRHEALSGRLQLSTLPRLVEVLFDTSGSLDFKVSGETAGGDAFLAVKLEGALPLICQRCLGALVFELSVNSRMMLVEPGSPWPDDGQTGGVGDEACDAVEAPGNLMPGWRAYPTVARAPLRTGASVLPQAESKNTRFFESIFLKQAPCRGFAGQGVPAVEK